MPRYYTEEHEWLDVDGDVATVGITDFAQGQLGFFLPFGLLRERLLNAATQLFLFSQRACRRQRSKHPQGCGVGDEATTT